MAKVSSSVRRQLGPLLISLATPLLLFVSMPGYAAWWPLLSVALAPLLLVVLRQSPGKSFGIGLLAGFLYHASMLYWIVIVLGRYGGLPPLISIPAMLLLALYMALYLALFCWGVSFLSAAYNPSESLPAILLFFAPLLWVALDWLRGFLFTGFPWMDLGYGLASQPLLIQTADLGGHHLVTFLVVMINVVVVFCIDWFRQGNSVPGGRARYTAAAAVIVLLSSCGYSVLRYQQLSATCSNSPLLQVGVVQGDIDQLDKWQPEHKRKTLNKYLELSTELSSARSPFLIVWPETAAPLFPTNDPLFATVRRWVDRNDVWLLTGAPHFELAGDLRYGSRSPLQYFNSAQLIGPSGTIMGRYEKEHLVPFGEYVPLRELLPFLEPLVESVGNFTVGRHVEPLDAGETGLGMLICYESIFPNLARNRINDGADVLVNITNDAWYGRSSAPFQSFSMAVLRSVETRRSLIRAANTGISGFVDPAGRTMEVSSIFAPLFLAAGVPLVGEKTVFVRFGYLFASACFILSALILLVCRWGK